MTKPSCVATAVDATAVIVTKDRREILRDAVESVLAQTVRPELLILDDGSTDGTFEMLRRDFPDVRAFRSQVSPGLVAQRTASARLATGAIIVFLDDDVVLPSRETLEKTLGEFNHPRIGAVAIPYIEQHEFPRARQLAPRGQAPSVTFRFAGGSHAVRRDVFLGIGGFRADLVQQGEETDFCLRMLSAGYVTRLGSAPPLLHLSAPPYEAALKTLYGSRNEVLHAWRNVPMPYLLPRLLKVLVRSVLVAAQFRQPVAALRGIARGLRDVAREPQQREPVTRAVYRLAHRLKVRRAVPLAEIEWRLPPRFRPVSGPPVLLDDHRRTGFAATFRW